MASVNDLRRLAEGLDHPEGVAVGADGMLYAGGEAGQIYRVDPSSGGFAQIASTGGFVLGLCLDAAGFIYACDAARAAIVRIDPGSGDVETFCDSWRRCSDVPQLARVRARRLARRLRLGSRGDRRPRGPGAPRTPWGR